MFVVLLGGAYYDVKEHRIPNWWILGAAICGACLTSLAAPEGRTVLAAAEYVLRLIIVTAALFPLFLMRMMGAGDIKIIAIMMACLGFPAGIQAIMRGGFLGAVLALVKLLMQKKLQQRLMYLFVYFRRLFQTREIVPYYQADRDGYGVVIPFAFCLCLGYAWYLLKRVF